MDSIQEFVKTANDRLLRLRKAFETSEAPVNCTADILPDVYLEIISRNGPESANQNEFGRLYPRVCGFNNVHRNWKPTQVRLGIMYPRNARYHYDEVLQVLNSFLSRRYGSR